MSCGKIITLVTLCCIGSLLAAVTSESEGSQGRQDQAIIEQIFKNGYNPDLRPANGTNPGLPISVQVNFYVRQIHYIDEQTGRWKAQLTFRQRWTDSRLAYKHLNPTFKHLTLPHSKVIWTPDTFITNELEGFEHSLWKPNQLLRVYPDGQVLFSSRITVTLASPALTTPSASIIRTATLRLASYAYTIEDIAYEWKPTDPVEVSTELNLKNYVFNKYVTSFCNAATQTGTYSCLKADFDFTKVVSVCNA